MDRVTQVMDMHLNVCNLIQLLLMVIVPTHDLYSPRRLRMASANNLIMHILKHQRELLSPSG